ncbi:hypothetical protein ABK040_014175 [Willaertia magna]
MSTKLSQFLKLSENTFTNNNINTNEIDQQQQTIDYQLLHQHLYNSIVFMDHSFAECFSWNDEFKATSLMNLGACLILDLENSNQWPSFERFKQLKEINKIWKDHSQNIKVTKKKEEEEDDEFEMFYSDEEEEEEKPINKNTNSSSKKELIDTSINFPKKNQTFDNENNTFNKAVFFVTELSSSFEKKLKEAIYHFQLNNLYFYCSFSDGFSEYYQSTLQYIISQKNLNNLFIPMKFKSLLNENTLTYSDLIQKAQMFILESKMMRNQKVKEEEEELNNVQVIHFPHHLSFLLPDVFFTPTCSDVFPVLPILLEEDRKNKRKSTNSSNNNNSRLSLSGLASFTTGSSNPEHREKKTILEFQELPIEYQLLYKKLAAVLRDVLKQLRFSADIYSLGQSSHLIAQDLQNLIEEERYNTNQSCTFILIDRTLDLVSPLCHSDNIYDKLLNTFNRISDRSMNITSNDKNQSNLLTSSFSSTKGVKQFLTSVKPFGLIHHNDLKSINLIRTILSKNSKDSLNEISSIVNSLQKISNKKNTDDIKQIISQLKTLMNNKGTTFILENNELLQLLSTILDGLDKLNNSTIYPKLSSIEKLLMWDSAANQSELLNSLLSTFGYDNNEFSLRDLFQLLTCLYSMVPPDIIFTDENKVKEMIVDNILKEMKLNNNNNSNNQKDIEFIKLLLPSSTISLLEKYGKESEQQNVETPKEEEEEEDWDNWDEFDEFSDDEQHHGNKKNKNNTSTQQQLNLLKETILKDLGIHFKCLRSITKQRLPFQTLSKLINNEQTFVPDNFSGILGQADTPYQSLAKQIVHVLGEKDNCSDLTHNTSLLSSITNTFGQFMFQSKQKLIRDESCAVFLFFVGGITAGEIADIRHMIDFHNKEKGKTSPFYNKEIYIGSTCLTSSNLIVNQLFSTV